MDTNKRDFTRVKTRVGASVSCGNDTLSGDVEDISLNGIGVLSERALPVGAKCHVVLTLLGAEPPVQIDVTGTVRRAEPGRVGIAFHETDSESYVHLQSLILLNAENADHVEEEFESSLGLKRRAADF